MSPLLEHRPSLWITHKENEPRPTNQPTNGFTCLPKHEGARDNKFLITHPMTDQRCLTSAIIRHRAPHLDRKYSLSIVISICYSNKAPMYSIKCRYKGSHFITLIMFGFDITVFRYVMFSRAGLDCPIPIKGKYFRMVRSEQYVFYRLLYRESRKR
jgi:hypothetical protein